MLFGWLERAELGLLRNPIITVSETEILQRLFGLIIILEGDVLEESLYVCLIT